MKILPWKITFNGLVIPLAALALFLFADLSGWAATGQDLSQVEYGSYLSRAGNCMSCHTRDDGPPYVGGRPFETPFGTVYSTNITPDRATGIGTWTLDDFATALREGERPGGQHLYPVFPYTAFTKMSDADIAALFAYFQTLEPETYTAPDNDLGFPYSKRWMLGAWKTLYFDADRFEPDPSQSKEWNRGAYLVQGPGHCGMCHTPRNFLGAQDDDMALTGATYQDRIEGQLLNWSSTNLTSAKSGLASWSADEIVSYLKFGVSTRAGVFGPMNEVVVNGTMHLTEEDLQAVATYLKALPANEQDSGSMPDDDVMRLGSVLYDIHCGTCHLPTGLGSEITGPPLVGSSVTLAADPASLINITLYGPQLPRMAPSEKWQSREWQPMDPYATILEDDEMAALLSYVRNAWGHSAGEVTEKQVTHQR